MLKRAITYEDFNGETVTDTHYFNISKSEILEMETEFDGGMRGYLQRIIDERDSPKIIKYFKELVLRAYGKKSDDGKRFIKSQELRDEFAQTAAYDTLFMELANDSVAASTFIQGCFPKDMSEQFEKALAEQAKTTSTT